MPHTRGKRFTAHCLCGASWDIRTSWEDDIRFFESMWSKLHPAGQRVASEDHGPATPSQAGRIRQRQMRDQLNRSSGASNRSEGTATGT